MSKEMTFAVFCLENYKVSSLFERYGVFDYLREFYDVLHTTGHHYINNDIDIYLNSRGYIPNP